MYLCFFLTNMRHAFKSYKHVVEKLREEKRQDCKIIQGWGESIYDNKKNGKTSSPFVRFLESERSVAQYKMLGRKMA